MLFDVTKQIEGHTICALGDAAAWPIQGLINHFRPVIEKRIDEYSYRSDPRRRSAPRGGVMPCIARRKTFELAVCLLGYYLGRVLGGWGGGIVLAFAGLCATSYGWERIATGIFAQQQGPTASMNFVYRQFRGHCCCSAFLLWGK